MASAALLTGIDLIDCAEANGKKGVEISARNCGYGSDIETFERELQQAGHSIGLEIDSFDNLITIRWTDEPGVEIAP